MEGRLLIIPNRQIVDCFSLTAVEKTTLSAMVDEGKKLLEERFKPEGYNVGLNVGNAAGQTVMHCHIHLIPRRAGARSRGHFDVSGILETWK